MANERRIGSSLFLFLLSIYLLTSALRIDSGDGDAMYRVACSIVTGQRFAIPFVPRTHDSFGPGGVFEPVSQFGGGDGYGYLGRDGRYYSHYGVGWSMIAAPFCALGQVLARTLGLPQGWMSRTAVMLVNPLLSALAAVFLYFLCRYTFDTNTSLKLALLYGLATPAWYYARSAFSEPLVALLLVAAILAVQKSRYTLSGLAIAAMIMTRQTAMLLALPVLIWPLFRSDRTPRWKKLLSIGIPAVLGQILAFAYNAYRFGNIFDTGYIDAAWDHPLLLGLYGQLLSPGKGVFIFAPILILGVLGWIRLPRRDWKWLLMMITIPYLIFHAMYSHWGGGGGWGPRFLLPLMALWILPVGIEWDRWNRTMIGWVMLILILATSVFIQVIGISVNWARHLQRVYDASSSPAEYDQRIHYSWSDNPILGQVVSLQEAINVLRLPQTRQAVREFRFNATPTTTADVWSVAIGFMSYNILDFWFIYFWFLDIPLVVLLMLSAILVIVMWRSWGYLRFLAASAVTNPDRHQHHTLR